MGPAWTSLRPDFRTISNFRKRHLVALGCSGN